MAERKQTTVKGDRSRVTKTQDYGDNFDGIPNFGFKPKWAKECDCRYHERQVCDICQNITGNELDKKVKKT